jgi:hypothetical protein
VAVLFGMRRGMGQIRVFRSLQREDVKLRDGCGRCSTRAPGARRGGAPRSRCCAIKDGFMWSRSVILVISGCLTGCLGVQTPHSVYKAWIDYNSLAEPSAAMERISHRPYRSHRVGEFAWMYNRPAGSNRIQIGEPLIVDAGPVSAESRLRPPIDLSDPLDELSPAGRIPGIENLPPPPALPSPALPLPAPPSPALPSLTPPSASQPGTTPSGIALPGLQSTSDVRTAVPRLPAMPLGRGLFSNPPREF